MTESDSSQSALRAAARSDACEVADLLRSKVVTHRRKFLGEAAYPYKVPFHSEDFWFTVLLSDCTYEFTGTHKRGYAVPARFCLSFKAPFETMLTTTYVQSWSDVLGVSAYKRDGMPEDLPTPQLLGESLHPLFYEIDFSPVRRVFLNASQIHVWSEFVDARQCAEQVRLFRQLLLTIHGSYDVPPNA